MRYYIFDPAQPHLHVFTSMDALDEALQHDYKKGKDWVGMQLFNGEGKKGEITYDGTIYQYTFGDEEMPVEELRRILTVYLPRIGWKAKRTAEPISEIDDVKAFHRVLAEHPPRMPLAYRALGCFFILLVIAMAAGLAYGIWVLVGPEYL